MLLKICMDFILEHGKSYVGRTRFLPSQRHVLLYYLLLRLSRHCGWLVLGPPLRVPRPEEDDVCIGQPPDSTGRMQCDHSAWYVEFAEEATLSRSEKLQMIEVSDTR